MVAKVQNAGSKEAYLRIKKAAKAMKSRTQRYKAEMEAGPVAHDVLYGTRAACQTFLDRWAADAGAPGIVDAAKDEEGDPSYDVVAEMTTVKTTADALVAWLDANIPAPPTFDPTQTATLRGHIDTLGATMD